MVFKLPASQIQAGIGSGDIRIAVIGLGQVGLPQALHFVRQGANVIGVDIDAERIDSIKRGVCPFATRELVEMFARFNKAESFEVTTDTLSAVRGSRIHILCLPTPLQGGDKPDFSALTLASEAVGRGLQRGNLVIVESTVYPGIIKELVIPALEKNSGLKAGRDFGLAYCFERIDPGNVIQRVDNTPRVLGGIDKESMDAAAAVYGIIVKAPITRVRDCQTAEMVKLVENIYRDVNIAFINEIAVLCDRIGVDVLEVLEAASTKWSFMPHIPGAGVGGMCIPINPYYLLHCARRAGTDLPLVRQARKTNENMPGHMVELVTKSLQQIDVPVKQAKICILGLAYKADVDDFRGAPGEIIARKLMQMGASVAAYDPVVTSNNNNLEIKDSIEDAIRGVNCIVVATDHSAFRSLNLKSVAKLAGHPLAIVDGRHIFRPREVAALGIIYAGVGRTGDSEINIWDFKAKLNQRKA